MKKKSNPLTLQNRGVIVKDKSKRMKEKSREEI